MILFLLALAVAQSAPASRPAAPKSSLLFTEVDAKGAGIDFEHNMGKTGQKMLVETMGSGVAAFDADGDGSPDLLLLQGAPLPGCPPFDSRTRLYINKGGWKFSDATDRSKLGPSGYALGAAVGDYNNDGMLDVYISAYGRGRLYRNRGAAEFEDVTDATGVAAEGFLASCAFGDLDNDGFVDLYITNYVEFAQAQANPYCGRHEPGGRAYCTPHAFNGAPDYLYRNDGGSKFADVSMAAGVARAGRFDGKSLGVVLSDFDDDGDLDIAVANDSCANYLYRNDGAMHFKEVATVAGIAFAEDGRERAGMGIDAADVDGDLRPDIFITNLSSEPNSLFKNLGKLQFDDVSAISGAGPPSVPMVGFGCALVDFDGDGDRDMLVADGHILDNAERFGDASPYKQRPLLFENDGLGHFSLLAANQPFLATPRVLRGLAVADFDGDGDPDAVATQSEGPPILLRNDGAAPGAFIRLRLKGTSSNAAGIGARVRWVAGAVERAAECRTGFSYLSASPPDLLLPLAGAPTAERVEVRWPSGVTSTLTQVGPGTVELFEPAGAASRPSNKR